MKRLLGLALIVSSLALVSACASPPGSSRSAPRTVGVQVYPQGAQPYVDAEASSASCRAEPDQTNRLEGPIPSPGDMPSGSYLARIVESGYLRVGVDQNTLLWGYRNSSGTLEGFDIDMVRQVAKAIFGPSNYESHIKYVVVPNADRITAVQSGEVDIVAETMTITAAREKCVDFSSVYYAANQEVLVPDNSPIASKSGLAGQRVCAAAGSTSITNIQQLNLTPPPQIWQVTNQTDCLVMLQQGQVDAISTDDTILEGLAAQDPEVKILTNVQLHPEPYGIAISKTHPDLTWFVDGVLAEEDSSSTCTTDDAQPRPLCWTTIWNRWLGPIFKTPAPHPPAPNEGL